MGNNHLHLLFVIVIDLLLLSLRIDIIAFSANQLYVPLPPKVIDTDCSSYIAGCKLVDSVLSCVSFARTVAPLSMRPFYWN